MEVVALVSGGKDSCFAMMRLLRWLISFPSMMPSTSSTVTCIRREQGLKYNVTAGDEVEDMFALLSEVKRQIPSITAVSSGAIASDYQRLRVESVCSRLGLVSLAYLWKQDQTSLFDEMIRRGIVAIIVKDARIVLDDFEVILHSSDPIAPVGILHPLAFHLELKPNSSGTIENSTIDQESSSCLYEVDGAIVHSDLESKQETLSPVTTVDACISKTGKKLFSIGCWVQDPCGTSKGLKADLVAVLSRIENQLKEEGLGWVNVLYVHLFISSMKEFGLANEIYVSFITEQKCPLGVPSRSTVELPLVQVGLGNASVEVLVTNEQAKRVLHVQSISCWAPSCIGPYSQATLHGEILYMAGQLGLDPPTMKLCPGGPTAELELALRNSEAVANAFGCSIFSSAIHFLVYCSAHLTSSEKEEVEHELHSSYVTNLDCSNTGSFPTILYVFASGLPKGAYVEIKPVLYVPTNDGVVATRELEAGGSWQASSKAFSAWGAQYSDLDDSFCQVHTIGGKICSAVVSVTNAIASKICSTTEQRYYLEEHLKALARFCAFQLAKILIDNGFSWDNLTMLRFYYSIEHSVTMDVMSRAFSEAFAELEEGGVGSCTTNGPPIFNIVPVSASGCSTSMSDIISCELLASKV
uniref:Diphthine--ammonia ligase n=1 Tax=Leersia perrieri TaxID=77586 RepID=A0A0D9VMG2_9ORYZ